MELRKLEKTEHIQTRKLWEEVFVEDTKEFLDYYYFLKVQDNDIYVIEEDEQIRSMLHLNPYRICVEDQSFPGHYIVAVATEEKYRKRRYMRELLCRSLKDMYDKKEAFTFLMPATEAIYAPYDFRFVYDQKQSKSKGITGELKIELKQARFTDVAEMVRFYRENFQDKYQIYAERDEKYFMTILFEQQSQYGGIMLMKSVEEIVGMFCYSNEGGFAVREPLYLKEYEEEFQKAVYAMKGNQDLVSVYASVKEYEESVDKPLIMIRILHLESLLSMLKVKPDSEIECSFAVLDTILTNNSRVFRITGGQNDNRKIRVRETEDSEGVLTIAALTSLIFGYKTVEEVQKEENVFLTDRLFEELKKIEPFSKVFLNEVV